MGTGKLLSLNEVASKMTHDDLMALLARLASEVYDALGSGHDESVYRKAMIVGLRAAQIPYQTLQSVSVRYLGEEVGVEEVDLLVGEDTERTVVELKVIEGQIGRPERQQVRNYMRTLCLRFGLIINFPKPGRAKGKADRTLIECEEVRLDSEHEPISHKGGDQ